MRHAAVPNPSTRGALRPVELTVTDRALRYRANANPPDGPECCHYCGATGGRLDIEHVDGHEENTAPENLAYACRSCNTTKGHVFATNGRGRRTRQYNPHASFSAPAAALAGRRAAAGGRVTFGAFSAWLEKHLASLPNKPTSAEIQEWRAAFMRGAARRSNPTRGAANPAQYAAAVRALLGHGGLAIGKAIARVQATPHAKRARFAQANPVPLAPAAPCRNCGHAKADHRGGRGRCSQCDCSRGKNPEVPTFEQYRWAIQTGNRKRYVRGVGWIKGAHDEAGKVIHATPPALRKQYNAEMDADRSRSRRARSEEVPF